MLDGGGTPLDATQVAVEWLEDCPLFNAGRGSVLSSEGVVEMDAAIMSGTDLRAGAVASITRVRHPVALARAVMEATPHVLITAAGAERLAEDCGLELCDADWFVTARQRERWLASQGTVGAVALDSGGHLAAATSTGGVREQRAGRVGDSPLNACEQVLRQGIAPLGGKAGLIAVDPAGNVATPFNTTLMHRGAVRGGGRPETALYADA